METPAQFIEQARGILTQQNELENLAQILHSQIEQLEKENKRLVCSVKLQNEKKIETFRTQVVTVIVS